MAEANKLLFNCRLGVREQERCIQRYTWSSALSPDVGEQSPMVGGGWCWDK